MRPGLRAASRWLTLLAFAAACTTLFGYLWVRSGGAIPGVTHDGYLVHARFADADNLVVGSEVRIAGVKVGTVSSLHATPRGAEAVLSLRRRPLHDGARASLRPRTLLEETYVELVDGGGAALPDGTRLPADAVRPSVQLDEVLDSFDPETREALGALTRSLGSSTADTDARVGALLASLGDLGRDGVDAVDVLAAQSQEIRALVRETTKLLVTLDAGNGQIADLVSGAHRLSDVTARHDHALASLVETLPQLVDATHRAAPAVDELSASLAPLAVSLRAAAPDLSAATSELAATTPALRGALPELDVVLDRAGGTLERVPRFGDALRGLLPNLDVALADLNPMLAYLEPYGPDIAAFWANYSVVGGFDAHGSYARIFVVFNEQSPTFLPLSSTPSALAGTNPYPSPGGHANPSPFTGAYPRVEEEK